jgi:hypothetical protein
MQRASHDRLSAPGTEGLFKVCFHPPLSKTLMHSLLHARAWETNRRRDHPDNFITTVWDQGTMGKCGLRSETTKGKQVQQEQLPQKRGRQTNQEHLENLVFNYILGNSSPTRMQIRGWERDLQTDPEDTEAEADILDFIHDPGNTRGRLSLFNQAIHTYWLMKCLLAKAIQSAHPPEFKVRPKTEHFLKELLEKIESHLHHIKLTQYQVTDRIQRMDDRMERMEKLLQQLQQVDMPGSHAKDPAPISSSDG